MVLSNFSRYSVDGRVVSLQEFCQFLREEQGQQESLDTVACIMRDFLQVRSRISKTAIPVLLFNRKK